MSPPVLATFDVARETRLETDAARTRGLGYALLQREPAREGESGQGQWRLVEAGSRFVTDTESRYATIELELLAAKWAMRKCRLYLLGLPHFTLVTDHQALKTVLDKKSLDVVENPRLQRMKAELTPYLFTTEWAKGKTHRVPDALSRYPIDDPAPEDEDDAAEMYGSIAAVVAAAMEVLERPGPDAEAGDAGTCLPSDDAMVDRVRKAGDSDPVYVALRQVILGQGPFPAEFRKAQGELWVDDGLVLYGRRIVVPAGERKNVVKQLHAAHLGEDRTLRRARQAVYWPGLTSDVKGHVRGCGPCQELRPSLPAQELLRDPPATFAFQEVAADYGEARGRHTLILVDRWSGFPAAYPVPGNPTSAKTIAALLQHFAVFGAPLRFFSDGALIFTSEEFAAFLEEWGIRHRVSSAEYPQSNGLAEVTVKTVKHLLWKTGGTTSTPEFLEGLLAYRVTPRDGGRSPSEMFSARPCVPRSRCSRQRGYSRRPPWRSTWQRPRRWPRRSRHKSMTARWYCRRYSLASGSESRARQTRDGGRQVSSCEKARIGTIGYRWTRVVECCATGARLGLFTRRSTRRLLREMGRWRPKRLSRRVVRQETCDVQTLTGSSTVWQRDRAVARRMVVIGVAVLGGVGLPGELVRVAFEEA